MLSATFLAYNKVLKVFSSQKQKFYDQMIGDVCFWPSKFEWYIFIVLFPNGCSRKCNDLIFTSMTSTCIDRLRRALSSGGIRITKFLTVFKKTRGRKSTPIS